jgi:hypothetical protein
MENQAPPPGRRRDDDGVEIVPIARGRRTFWLIGLAVALPIVVTLAAVVVIRGTPSSRAGDAPRARDEAETLARVAAAAPRVAPRPVPVATRGAAAAIVPRRIAETVPAAPGASPTPKAEKPRREIDARDAIEMLREAGEHEGIAAFGLPGSDPPKAGIIVPEDFDLPEGYVRHYQSTDDGEQLPAILMFHPDYEFLDAQGQVVKLPADRIVPPEMAPPGLAVDHMLAVPERKPGEPLR